MRRVKVTNTSTAKIFRFLCALKRETSGNIPRTRGILSACNQPAVPGLPPRYGLARGRKVPKRIQRKRTKGWRMPAGAIYVGRGTKWGNPFTGPDAVEKYRWALSEFPSAERHKAWNDAGGTGIMHVALASRNKAVLDVLRGHDLACWCPLNKPCHADVLLEIANG